MEVGIAFMTRQQALLTLGLSMAARENDIRNAWRKKAKFFHPDSPYANTQAFLKSRQAFETQYLSVFFTQIDTAHIFICTDFFRRAFKQCLALK